MSVNVYESVERRRSRCDQLIWRFDRRYRLLPTPSGHQGWRYTGWAKKFGTVCLYALTLPNINRFS